MDFIDLPSFDVTPLLWMFVPVIIVVAVGISMLTLSNRERVYETGARIAYTGLGVVAVGVIIFMVFQAQYRTEVSEVVDERVASIEDAYGLELSDEEYSDLNYPLTEPESDFEVFGSFTRSAETTGGFEKSTVHLIWKDGALHLAESADGESFDVLDTAR